MISLSRPLQNPQKREEKYAFDVAVDSPIDGAIKDVPRRTLKVAPKGELLDLYKDAQESEFNVALDLHRWLHLLLHSLMHRSARE